MSKSTVPPKSLTDFEFGSQLLDSISIPEDTLNILFAALLATAVGVFLGGNLLMLDWSVVQGTTSIALTCLALLLIFYGLSRYLNSVAWGLVITYGLMWLLSYSHWQWLLPCLYICALFWVVYAIRFLRVESREFGLVFLMGLLATALILGCDGTYTFFDMLQRLHAGSVHQDTLFHASIAAMIKNYGVVSTGLHGLIGTPYHVLSHGFMASISILSGASVFEVYGVAPWVLFAPILIFSVVACCQMLNANGWTNIPLAWGLVCVFFVLAPWLLNRWAFWNSFLVSESYLVSLGLFLVGLPLLFKRNLSVADLFLAPILAALISNSIGSVGLVFAGLWLLRVIFIRGGRFYFDLLALVLTGFAVGLVTFDSASASAPTKIVPLHFIRAYSFFGQYLAEVGKSLMNAGDVSWRSACLALVAIFSFIGLHFLFSWIVVIRLAYKQGVRSLLKAPGTVYSLGAVAAGMLIVVFFEIPGGSAYYFSNIAFFVSLPLVVVLVLNYVDNLDSNIKFITSRALGFALVVIIIMGGKGVRDLFATHQKDVLQHSAFVDSLVDLRHQSPINVFIQLDPVAMAKNPLTLCWAQPFVYPAISERPWVNVIVPRDDCIYQYYGYAQYGLTPTQQSVALPPRILPGMKELSWPRTLDIFGR